MMHQLRRSVATGPWTLFPALMLAMLTMGCGEPAAEENDVRRTDESRARSNQELVQNGDFSQHGPRLPIGWWQDLDQTGTRGEVVIETADSAVGTASLKLQPNEENREDNPLAVAQTVAANAYRGQDVSFSAAMRAGGGATAILGLVALQNGTPGELVMLHQAAAPEGWTYHEGHYRVPDEENVELVIICMVNGRSGSAWFDDVSLRPKQTASPPPSSPDPPVGPGTIVIDAEKIVRRIPSTLFGTNIEWRWNANFLWQESHDRVDPEIERLTRELGVTLVRFPGGIYSDYYHWRDGIGPREQRQPVRHEPGSDDESVPLFGTDEALAFADSIDGELLITVNAGTGTAEEAADWVRYVNRDELRVRYWEVGNELYYDDGSVFAGTVLLDPITYAERFLEFARKMREADPRIKVGAIGGENRPRYELMHDPDCNRVLLERAGDEIDFLAVHNAYAPLVFDDSQELRAVYRAMLAAPVGLESNLRTLRDQLHQLVPDRADEIELAITEWGPFFHVDFGNRYLKHTKSLGSALYVARAFNTFLRSPETTIANFWCLNDVGVLGWIGTSDPSFPPRPEWTPTARYFALQMYTQHFGSTLVGTRVESPTFDSPAVGFIEATRDVPYLDAVSSLSEDGRSLFIMVINTHFDEPIEVELSIQGFLPQSRGELTVLTGTSIDANTGTRFLEIPGLTLATPAEDSVNPRFRRGHPRELTKESASLTGVTGRFTHSFPARSVTALRLARQTD